MDMFCSLTSTAVTQLATGCPDLESLQLYWNLHITDATLLQLAAYNR